MGAASVFYPGFLLPVEVEIAAMQKPAYDVNLAIAFSVVTGERTSPEQLPGFL